MLKAAKKILSQIRGLIIKDKEDQPPATAGVPSEATEASSPAPPAAVPQPNIPMTEPLPPADPISDSPPHDGPRPGLPVS